MSFPTGNTALHGVTILLLEDHDDTRKALVALLQALGMIVLPAGCIGDAVRLLERASPSLILSDLGLPDGDGYDFIESVRRDPGRDSEALPAVAMSALASPEVRRHALASGFQAFFSKPFDFDLVAVKLVELAAAARASALA
ncbi:MAG: response regulator [Polyangiaceae bacterium]|jgi:CheY-like chemotaxis protein|nr:response regulator [Polyangiaceae bacterium]